MEKGGEVRAIVRLEADNDKIKRLEKRGAKVFRVDMESRSEISKCCIGADCVLSALAGLAETVLDAQQIVLDAAVQARVKRFVPSDYSSNFTDLVPGQNRNLDLRREFHYYLDKAPIQATTIFNGPFMDLLVTDVPLILFKKYRILCWGNPNQLIEFTTTYNIAEFAAEVALEDETPRYLRIAGDRLSCRDFVDLLTRLSGKQYRLFRPGGIGLLNFVIKLARFFSPSKNELYPAWQGMQYMRDMMEGRIVFQKYDNDRYPGIKCTTVREFLPDHADGEMRS